MNNDWQKRIRDFIGVPPEVDLTGHDCCTMCGQPTKKAPQVDELIGMISEELDNREAEVRLKILQAARKILPTAAPNTIALIKEITNGKTGL